jgi:anti-anti-sigma factor
MHSAMADIPANSELSTHIVREPAGVRLLLRGELDMNGVLEAERAVEASAALVPEGGRLTIDLAELEFMDLFGARVLLRTADSALTPEREVVIANPRGHVRRLFELITDLARGRSLVTELVRPVG